jgi:AraC-like DNA-binding protein
MAGKTKKTKLIRKKYIGGRPGHVLDADYFYYETEPGYSKNLAIICGGREKCAPDYQLDRISYPYHVIKYTISGKGAFSIHGTTHQLKTGVLSGFSPKDAHSYACDPANPMEHIFVIFVGTEASQLFKRSTLAAKGAFEVANPAETLYLLRAIMKTGLEKEPYSQQICCSYLRAILLRQAAKTDDSAAGFSLATETYQRCKKYIDDNFSHIASPSDAADACAVNIRYMARLFRLHGKITPHDYILRLKLNKAANMLLTCGLSINEIGYSLGFNDPYHFSRVFKRFHGLSPKSYRNLHLA